MAPRLEEIFALVEDEIRRSGFLHRVPAGIVLTGGSAQLEGIDGYAEQRLRMPARIGTPSHIAGLVEAVGSPAFATGVGLVLYGARGRAYTAGGARNGAASVWARARAWLRDVLQGG
jgi:cell division protein FtsA